MARTTTTSTTTSSTSTETSQLLQVPERAESAPIRALVTLPDEPYYLWQALVHAWWMRQLDWPVTYLVYLGAAGNATEDRAATPRPETPYLRQLREVADVEVWMDWRRRSELTYHPAMKPWLVAKYLERYPAAASAAHVLLDPDALPTRPEVAATLPRPSAVAWWGTDTDSYTGPGYLGHKGVWEALCALTGADPTGCAEERGAGAQVAFQDAPAPFWADVALTSVRAHDLLVRIGPGLRPEGDDYPVQAWCSEMYVTQLMACAEGRPLRAHPGMEMVWANGPAEAWESAAFFHDAGVTTPQGEGEHFYKIAYQHSPWGHGIPTPGAHSASRRYVEIIRAVERDWPERVWR